MKKLLLLILLSFLLTTCESKIKVISLSDYCNYDYKKTENIYVKDINGIFDPYIGVWVWQNNENKLILIINKVKKIKSKYLKKQIFKDELQGRIKYIKNNKQEVNTLNDSIPTLRSIIKYKTLYNDTLPVIEQNCGIYSKDSIRLSYNNPLRKVITEGHGSIKLISKNKISLIIENGGITNQSVIKPVDALKALIERREIKYSLSPINQTFTFIKK